jgi:hypothetical protein
MKALLTTIACVSLLAAPALARGADHLIPPGKSGADQYFETIPSSAGNAAPPQGTPTSSAPAAVAVTPTARAGARALGRRGKDGKAASSLARDTAPPPLAPSSGEPSGRAGHGGIGSTLSRALGSDSGGLGAAFPILLLATLLAALAVGAARWRRRDDAAT